jgi:membrane-bound transcription factor site-1 protease
MIQMITMIDDNTKRWWHPLTGGANLPALNDLLQPFGIAFGDGVWHGMVSYTFDIYDIN